MPDESQMKTFFVVEHEELHPHAPCLYVVKAETLADVTTSCKGSMNIYNVFTAEPETPQPFNRLNGTKLKFKSRVDPTFIARTLLQTVCYELRDASPDTIENATILAVELLTQLKMKNGGD